MHGGTKRTLLPVVEFSLFLSLIVSVISLSSTGCRKDAPAGLSAARQYAAAMAAHHLCAGVFVVGRDYKRSPEQVLEQDIAPFPVFQWQDEFEYSVDDEKRTATVWGPGIDARTAKYNGDQGCTILPPGEADVYYDPVEVPRSLPDASAQDWPTGDVGARGEFPPEVDPAKLAAALDWGMQQPQNTRALVVTYQGKILGERYAPGFTKDTPQISWSQGKSITAALVGILVRQGHLDVEDPAPVAEWQKPGDPRSEIKIKHLLNMSSGLDFKNYGLGAPNSWSTENEHFRIYFDALNVFDHAVNQPLEIPPGSQFRYRNSDPLTLGRIVRQIVEDQGENYLTFPQRALFDRIGARNFVLETDPYGDFIMTGYDFGSAWDWTRFGLLHLWDGVWEGERILPEGWVKFISTPAPGAAEQQYGGLFWLNRGGAMDRVPQDAFWAAGFMGQTTLIIPSRQMVFVRLGPSPGGYSSYLNELVGRVLDAIEPTS
jgi:CubicO group peptidase (beta-lactamase class C family)